MRIFLAEDEQDLNAIIVQKLTEDGYSVDHCFDGRTAIAVSYTHLDVYKRQMQQIQVNGSLLKIRMSRLSTKRHLKRHRKE